MRVIYQGVDLMAVETHEFFAEPVYDDTRTDYLYTRFSLVVTALVNGQASVVDGAGAAVGPVMSYAFSEGEVLSFSDQPLSIRNPVKPVGEIKSGNNDGAAVGLLNRGLRTIIRTPNAPPLTHEAVRHRLTTPRGKLYVFAGTGMEGGAGAPAAGTNQPPNTAVSQLFLEAPAGSLLTDCKNGPTPRILGVTAMLGDAATMLWDFAIECYVSECDVNNARPFGALVSNRWKQSHAVKDGYMTVTTQGTAIFRTDLLTAALSSADVDRMNLFMPIPQSFKREVDYVDTREDGTGIVYGYTDTQQPVNFVAGPYVGACDITAVHRQSVTANVDILGGAFSLAERATNMLLNAKWLKGERAKPPGRGAASAAPVAPGGPGAGRLRIPGAPPGP